MKRAGLLSLVFLFAGPAFAQFYKPIDNWTYLPTDETFWSEATKSADAGDFANAWSAADGKLKKAQGLEKAEAELAQAQTLEKMGLNVLAYHRYLALIETYPGSAPGLQALVRAEKLLIQYDYDMDAIIRILNVGNFTDVAKESQSFVAYAVLVSDLRRHLKSWSTQWEKGLDENSYWAIQYDLQKLLLAYNKKALNREFLEELDDLRERAVKFPKLVAFIDFQRARTLFAIGKIEDAEALYLGMTVRNREFGRSVFERAWIKYVQRDYSLSLGLIEALKTPFFADAQDPEHFILSMVVYRDLCHYPAVRKLAAEYYKIYNPVADHIKALKPLEENRILVKLMAQRGAFYASAEEITRLDAELGQLVVNSWKLGGDTVGKLTNNGKELKKILIARLHRKAGPQLKAEAERVLRTTEQVKLLEYLSDLDEHRFGQMFENRTYQSKDAETFAIDQLYWPVAGEFWWDEIKNYRVLIWDRCKAGKADKK